jgi:4-methyl-5(b-hydroxyethyl)-thiazole monophosphate biosynthesis
MKRVLLVLSRGFEELEAVAPLDLLRRAGLEVVSASAQEGLLVEGSHGIRIEADRPLDDCLSQAWDLVILPGGPGVEGLRKDGRVLDLVRRSHEGGVPLAAICAAPLVLADAGVAASHAVTSFPATRTEMEPKAAAYSEERVVVDGKVITSRGAGTAEEFSLALIEYLLGPGAAEDVRRRIVAR